MAGGLDLGDLYSKLRVDYKDVIEAEAKARKFADSSTASFAAVEKSASKLKSVGTVLTGVSVAMLGFGAASFNAAKDFGDSFSDVEKSISDLNSSNIGAFKNEILAIGQNSLLSASGVAQLAAAGGKLGDGAKDALEFAKASEQIAVAFDFGKTVEAASQAGDIIGNLRSSFGMTTKEVLEFADAFNYFGDVTASSSKNITEIIARQGATVANATNLTKGELAALAASFDSVAPSAEIAATGMKNMILSMAAGSAATKRQSSAFAALGFDAEQLAKDLTTDAAGSITKVLEALGKVDKAEQAAITMKLFGRESIGAISPLIGNLEMLKTNFENAADSSKFLGSVKKEYDRLNNSDNAKFTKAMNALNVSMIKIGSVLLPVLAQAAGAFTKFLTSVNELDPGLVRIGVVIAGVAAAIGPLLLGLGAAAGAFAPLVASAGGIGAAFGTLAAMAGPVGLAVAAVAASAYLIYKNWGKVSKFVIEMVNGIIAWFKKWKEENAGLISELMKAWDALLAAGLQLWTTLSTVVGKAVSEMLVVLEQLFEPIGGLAGVWELLKVAAGLALTAILGGLVLFVQGVTQTLQAVGAVVTVAGEVWSWLMQTVSTAITGIRAWLSTWASENASLVGNISEKWGTLVASAQMLWGAIVNFTKEGIANTTAMVQSFWQTISAFVSEGVANTTAMLDSLLAPIGGLQGAWEIFSITVGAVFTTLVNHLGILMDFVSTTFTAIAGYLNGNASLWETLKTIVGAAVNGVIAAVKNLWSLMKPGIQAIWDGIVAFDWKQLGVNMMKGLAAGIASAAGAVKDAALKGVTDAYEGAKDFLGIKSPSRLFMDIGKYTMAGLAIGIAEGSSDAERQAEIAAGRVLMAYESGIQAHKEQTTASLMEAMGMRGADSSSMGMGMGMGGMGMGSGMGMGVGMGGEFEDVGGGSVAGMPDLAGISAYYDERLALLTEKGMAETQLFQAIEAQKQDIVSQAQRVTLSTYANAFDGVLNATAQFAGKQSGIYRAMFAASKAFAIAESLVAIQQNIANAMKVGFPQNIPFIAGAIAQGGGILSSLKSIAAPSSAGAFYNGGVIPGGKTGIAGEKGVELVGPAGVMSTQKTKELLSGGGSGGVANVNITVEIIDNSGSGNSFSVEQSEDNKIRIVVDRVKKEISADIARGSGAITSTLENRYGLKRK